MKPFRLLILVLLSFGFFLLLKQSTLARKPIHFGTGWYTNLCGTAFDATAYTCSANCSTSTGSCSGGAESVVKWTCSGELGECRNPNGESSWTSSHRMDDGFGQTQQIDVLDRKCRLH